MTKLKKVSHLLPLQITLDVRYCTVYGATAYGLHGLTCTGSISLDYFFSHHTNISFSFSFYLLGSPFCSPVMSPLNLTDCESNSWKTFLWIVTTSVTPEEKILLS